MLPNDLDQESLYAFVFGPGYGESSAIRIPPNHWVIIDSCEVGGVPAASSLLTRYLGIRSCVVLTHRHSDHYFGMAKLLEGSNWNHVGCSDPNLGDVKFTSIDANKLLENSIEELYSRIRRNWKQQPNSEWWTWRGTTRQVGDAELKVIHPEQYMAGQPQNRQYQHSTAIRIHWKNTRLLFSGDIVGENWENIANDPSIGPQGDHCFLKVPHHSSTASVHDCFASGNGNRNWVTTAYCSAPKLPDFNDGKGGQMLLECVDSLYATAMPDGTTVPSGTTEPISRADLLQLQAARKGTFSLPGSLTGVAKSRADAIANCVVFKFTPEGDRNLEFRGANTVHIKR